MPLFKRFLFFIVPFSIAFYVLQFFLKDSFLPAVPLYFSQWSMHLFMVIASLMVYLLVNYINNVAADKAGFVFLGLGFLKMLAAIVFLFPLIQNETFDKIPTVIYFFITYFVYLFVETLFIVRLLNKK